jgi:multiple sugar transport system permease protein
MLVEDDVPLALREVATMPTPPIPAPGSTPGPQAGLATDLVLVPVPPAGRTPGGTSRRVIGGRLLWLTWPSVALLTIIIIIPFLIAFYISFLKLDQYTLLSWIHAPWIGLTNYVQALTAGSVVGASALQSIAVSVGFSVLTTLFIIPIGILAALTVNTPIRGRAIIRSLYLVPYILPIFVNALLWRMMFLNHTGLVDQFLARIHVASIDTYWLLGGNSFWALVIADTWASWAFIYIIVLAGLQSVPHEMYEAADIDGANAWQKLTRVVLPQMRGLLVLGVLLSTLNHFNNFTLPFVMFGTPPPSQADVLPLNVYVSSFQLFNFGLGAAMSVLTLLLMLIPGFIYLRALRLGEVAAA